MPTKPSPNSSLILTSRLVENFEFGEGRWAVSQNLILTSCFFPGALYHHCGGGEF